MTAVISGEVQSGTISDVLQGHAELTVHTAPAVRTGFLGEVWTASARVESLQWEMDSAQDDLLQALRDAAAAGAGLPDLSIASGLPFAELEKLIG
ncbi:hypothetical protein [Paenarthrobacter ilicis]|uniref:hypothetical protein n=1 Tax=Paenarthrobacter ilicis TaxID=43665 RepID=UPI0028D10241|nr:hypothetical protein [Paenarthrobacter ilicis]